MEVLVTLVILSTGIVMLLRALQTSVTGLERARDALFASLLCREKLVDIEADVRTGNRPPASSNGDFEGIYAAFRWSMAATQEESVKPESEKKTGGDDPPPVTLYKISIEAWREGREDTQQATTYLIY